MLTILETFGGYTYSTLMKEDAELFRLIKIRAMGRAEEGGESGE